MYFRRPNQSATEPVSKVGSRMRYAPRALLAGGLGFAVSCLAACGGGAGLLSGSDSSNLNSQLDSVSAAVDGGHCGAASSAVATLGNSVRNLPAKVNPALRANLLQGVSTVAVLAQHDCRTTSTNPATSPTTTTTTQSTTTTTTTPSSTSTTPPSSTSTTPATSSTTPGTTSTSGGSGGAGLAGGGSGGAGSGGSNGNGGNGQ
jgi:hypothetical protein